MYGEWGTVTAVIEWRNRAQIVEVENSAGRKYPAFFYHPAEGTGQLVIGDRVYVNTTALDLNLGTGGYGFISTVDRPSPRDKNYPGHVLKLRYTPHQAPVLCIEAQESEHHHLFGKPFDLQGKRIVVGELHSMLPIFLALIYQDHPQRRCVYLMDDQASLQLSFSDHVQHLKERLSLTTITYGQATGGDLECVNIYTALEAASKVVQADDMIITQGPGVVGTGTERGFSGMALAHWIHAIRSCGGEAVVIPRLHSGDRRARHLGFSHHTLTPLLQHVFVQAHVPVPALESLRTMPSLNDDPAILKNLHEQIRLLRKRHHVYEIPIETFYKPLQKALQWYGKSIQTMGKSFGADPLFFLGIAAAHSWYRGV